MNQPKLANAIIAFFLCTTIISCSDDEVEPAVDPGIYKGNITITTQQELNDVGSAKYHTIEGNLIISDNEMINDIVDLSNLSSIRNVEGTLEINNMANILDVAGLENIRSVGALVISENWGILDVLGLSNISSCTGDILIESNQSLENYCGLTKLLTEGTFDGDLTINNNFYNPTKQQIINGECSN